MTSFFISSLVLASFFSGAKAHQEVLNRPPSFIQSSIFSKSFDTESSPEPITVPPSFYPRELNDWPAGSIGTFAHLEFTECTEIESSGTFDIGIVGHPFDLGVSYRPGARFGPNGARQGARRISPAAGWE
jgi:agmatinase